MPDDRELCAATFCGHRRTLGRTRRTGAHRTRRGRVRPSGRHLTAAIGVGFLATLISIRRQAPALVTATAGIMPMLPGLAVFRAVFAFAVNDTPDGGLTQLLEAAATALALGSGVVLGEFLASPLRYGAGRIGDLFRIEVHPGSGGRSAVWCAYSRPRASSRPAPVANGGEASRWSRRRPTTWTPAIAAIGPLPAPARPRCASQPRQRRPTAPS